MRNPLLMVALFLLLCSASLADPIVVSGGDDIDSYPSIARRGNGGLVVAFMRSIVQGSSFISDIYVSTSIDGGQTWSEPVLAVGSPDTDERIAEIVELPSDTLVFMYDSDASGNYRLYLAKSADGVSWSSSGPLELGWASYVEQAEPNLIAEDDTTLTISYQANYNCYVAHSTDGGLSWNQGQTEIASSHRFPKIMRTSAGRYYCTLQTIGNPQSFEVTSSDDRVNWSAPIQPVALGNNHDSYPTEYFGDSLVVYYTSSLAGEYFQLCRVFSPDGVVWGEPQQVTSDYEVMHEKPHPIEGGYGHILLTWDMAYLNGSYLDDIDIVFEDFSDLTSVEEEIGDLSLLSGFAAVSSYPNPFNSETVITYSLSLDSPGKVELEVYNLRGELVRQLAEGSASSGSCSVTWDGRDNSGEEIATGLYFLRLTTDGGVVNRKLTLLR